MMKCQWKFDENRSRLLLIECERVISIGCLLETIASFSQRRAREEVVGIKVGATISKSKSA